MTGCEGCVYYRKIAQSNTDKVCHYLLDTGRARLLICPPGDACTVRQEGEKKPAKRALQHKYDFTPSPKKPRNVLDQGRAAALYAHGYTDVEIGRRLGAKAGTVRAWRGRTGRSANAGRGRPPKKGAQSAG